MPTSGFSIKPLKVKLLAGEQKATEKFPTFCHFAHFQVVLRRLDAGTSHLSAWNAGIAGCARAEQRPGWQASGRLLFFLRGQLVLNQRKGCKLSFLLRASYCGIAFQDWSKAKPRGTSKIEFFDRCYAQGTKSNHGTGTWPSKVVRLWALQLE